MEMMLQQLAHLVVESIRSAIQRADWRTTGFSGAIRPKVRALEAEHRVQETAVWA